MQDEQSSEGQQPDAWAAWSAQADQSGQAAPGGPSSPSGDSAQPADGGLQSESDQPGQRDQTGHGGQAGGYGYGHPGSYPPPPPPPGLGQPGSHTQPLGYPQPGQYGGYGDYGQQGPYGQQSPYGQQGPYGPYGYGQGPYGQPGYSTYAGYGQPSPRRRRITNVIAYIAVAAVAAVAGGLVVDIAGGGANHPAANSSGTGGNGSNPFNISPGQGNGNGQSGNGGSNNSGVSSATERKVRDAVLPGLVIITSSLRYQDDAAEATGMVISPSGLVLTNNHVIDGTTGLTATVASTGQRFPAQWVGYDKSSDIAVIKLIGASGLRTVPIGNSSTTKVNDGVVAMGNADGHGSIATVTGRVTGLNQRITASDQGADSSEQLTGMIRTNAYIIPGDSGGPLANVHGQVIGMDTAASTNAAGVGQQNVGFAIPINKAMTIARQITTGKASSAVRIGSVGFLGVVVVGGPKGQQLTVASPLAQLNQEKRNLQQQGGGFGGFGGSPGNGCLPNDTEAGVPSKIASVSSGTLILGSLCSTPAAQAGLVPGDVITSVAGHAVSSPASLVTILSRLRSGQSVKVVWATPAGSTVDHSMTLAPAPPA